MGGLTSSRMSRRAFGTMARGARGSAGKAAPRAQASGAPRLSPEGGLSAWPLFWLAPVFLWSSFLMKPLVAAAPLSYEAFYAAQPVALALAALLYSPGRRSRAASPSRTAVAASTAACCALMLACAPVVLFPEALPGGPSVWLVAGGAMVGGTWAFMLASLFDVYARIAPARMAACVLGSLAAFPLMRLAIEFLPIQASVAACSLVPLASVPAVLKARDAAGLPVKRRDAAEPGRRAVRPAEGDGGLAMVVALVGLYGLAMGMLRVDAQPSQDNPAAAVLCLLIKAALPLALLAMARRSYAQASVGLLCQLTLVLAMVGIMAAVVLGDDPWLSFSVLDCTRQLFYVLLYFALCALSQGMARPPVAVFALGWGLYTAAIAAGMALGHAMGGFGSFSEGLVVSIMCLLTCATVLAFNFRGAGDVRLFADGSPEGVPPVADFATIDGRCAAMAEGRGLTGRELDCMRLICKGRSKRYIAEELGISENTVRSYARSLYAKLGIHSRDELMAAIEQGGPR